LVQQGVSYRFEMAEWRRGCARIAGVDESGRGPLAGPVVAAAVILDARTRIDGLDDCKRLPPEERERLFGVIALEALAVGVAEVDAATIDRINILAATRVAMGRALSSLGVDPELVLTDFVELAGLDCPQRNLVRGDQRSASIAAASIVAKVTRDRLMEAAGRQYPQYGFGQNKGYATPAHRAAIWQHGPCPLHRQSFASVWAQGELFQMDVPLSPRGAAPVSFDLVLAEE
jgi:ribonuclease HII